MYYFSFYIFCHIFCVKQEEPISNILLKQQIRWGKKSEEHQKACKKCAEEPYCKILEFQRWNANRNAQENLQILPGRADSLYLASASTELRCVCCRLNALNDFPAHFHY